MSNAGFAALVGVVLLVAGACSQSDGGGKLVDAGQAVAQEAVTGSFGDDIRSLLESFAQMDRVYQEFGDQLGEVYERVRSDSRVVTFQVAWAACMTEAGYSFGSMDEMFEEVSNRTNELYGSFEGPLPLNEAEMEVMTDYELNEYFSSPEPDPVVAAEVQDFEITVAVASWDCDGMSQNEIVQRLSGQYQRDFIDENLDAIRALLNDEG